MQGASNLSSPIRFSTCLCFGDGLDLWLCCIIKRWCKREREKAKKKNNRKALNKVNWLPNFVNYIANTKNLVKKKINKHKLNKLI